MILLETDLSDAEQTVLLSVAHPDDGDFTCGGTVAHLIARGARVQYVVATDGQAGETHIPLAQERLGEIRQQEQREAAKILGASNVTFLDLPDGRLKANWRLKRLLTLQIRKHRPNLVITHAPERNYDSIRFSHPDHIALGEATLSAIYPYSRNADSFRGDSEVGHLQPHTVPEVWLFGSANHDHYIDITDRFDQKISAIKCHRSQIPPHRDNDSFFRGWAEELALEAGMGTGRLAEAYKRLDTR